MRAFVRGHSTIWQELPDELLVKGVSTSAPLPADYSVTSERFEVLRREGLWAPFLGRHLHFLLKHPDHTFKGELSLQLAVEVIRRACGVSALNIKDAIKALRMHWNLAKSSRYEAIASHMLMASRALGMHVQELGFEVALAWTPTSSLLALTATIMRDAEAAVMSVVENLEAFASQPTAIIASYEIENYVVKIEAEM